MRRRHLLAGMGLLAAPSIVQAQNSRVLRFVPTSGVTQLDPVRTLAYPTMALALQVCESLYSVDDKLQPHPQMAAGHTVEDDGKRWNIRLRDGLRFHDNEPVLARDCVASINRWMKRDLTGRTLAMRLDVLEAPDDRTVVFRLKKPFSRLPFVLGKSQPNVLPIMPVRLAVTDPGQAITELVGSGPFRFVANEFSAGDLAVLARFEAYRPRDEPAIGTSGGRLAKIDRIEWRTLPDASTAANALMTGEVDWVENPIPEMLSRFRQNRNIVVEVLDRYGNCPLLRPNHVSGPTADLAVRRAIMSTLDGQEIVEAAVSGEPGMAKGPMGLYVPGSPFETNAGMERLGPKPPVEIKAMLKAAGYANERLVLLHQIDIATNDIMIQIVARRLADAGFNIDDQVMDYGTYQMRRENREAPDKGGWSLLLTAGPGPDFVSPLINLALRTGPAAWVGWPNSAVMEELRERWIDSSDDVEQKQLAAKIQETALADVFYVPLGHFVKNSAWRSNVSGILKMNVPVMWNVSKS
jgi:peptide/nickel transport system substrate-binding protein